MPLIQVPLFFQDPEITMPQCMNRHHWVSNTWQQVTST